MEESELLDGGALRIVSPPEQNFLHCIKYGLWGAKNNIFTNWKPGDLIAFKVGNEIAALAKVTGPPISSSDPVWPDQLYPHRIPIHFIVAQLPPNRLPIEGSIREAIIESWAPKYGRGKYGLGYQKQDIVSNPHADVVLAAIAKQPNDLDTIKLRIDELIANAKGISSTKVSRPSNKFNRPLEERVKKSWIFQANPKIYDIDAALRELSEICWLIKQHSDEIHANDRVFLWKAGASAGIVAIASVQSGPAMMDEPVDDQRFNVDEGKFEGPRLRVRLRIVRRVEPMLSRTTILGEPKLTNLSILKAPQGTNFSVTDEETAALMNLISLNTDGTEEAEEPTSYSIEDALSGLFLSETEVREMLRLWRAKRNLILQGPPGVGKTFIGKRLAYALIGFKNLRKLQMIQFHQSFSYEDFMQGYRPSPDGGFIRKDGPFFEFCALASKDPDGIYVFVIDEINRGNLSKIFGEALMLIEADKRSPDYSVKLTYSTPADAAFFVPANVYILGMMNTADRSIALVDYALRRRFAFVRLEPQMQSASFKAFLVDRKASEELSTKIIQRITALNKEISEDPDLGAGFTIGHSFFCPSDSSIALDDEWYRGVIETEVVPLLREYWFDDQHERAEQWRTKLLAPT